MQPGFLKIPLLNFKWEVIAMLSNVSLKMLCDLWGDKYYKEPSRFLDKNGNFVERERFPHFLNCYVRSFPAFVTRSEGGEKNNLITKTDCL